MRGLGPGLLVIILSVAVGFGFWGITGRYLIWDTVWSNIGASYVVIAIIAILMEKRKEKKELENCNC